jgi:hypothetical protein
MPPGRINFKLLFFLAVLAVGCFLAIKFIPPYWTYLSLQDPVKEAAMTAVSRTGGEEAARADLIRRAAEQGVSLGEENIRFIRDGSMLTLRVRWSETVDLPGYRVRIPFQIEQRVPAP